MGTGNEMMGKARHWANNRSIHSRTVCIALQVLTGEGMGGEGNGEGGEGEGLEGVGGDLEGLEGLGGEGSEGLEGGGEA